MVGEGGSVELPHPFMPEGQRRGRTGSILLERGGERELIEVPSERDCFELEALAFRDQVRAGALEPSWPLVDHAETLAIARLQAEWRALLPAALAAPTGP